MDPEAVAGGLGLGPTAEMGGGGPTGTDVFVIAAVAAAAEGWVDIAVFGVEAVEDRCCLEDDRLDKLKRGWKNT